MTESYLLGIDIGTSTVKSVLFNIEGQEIAAASPRSPERGGSFQPGTDLFPLRTPRPGDR